MKPPPNKVRQHGGADHATKAAAVGIDRGRGRVWLDDGPGAIDSQRLRSLLTSTQMLPRYMTQTSSRTEETGPLLAVGDLIAVAGYATLVVGLALTGVLTGGARVLLVGALLGLCPGYAIVSAFYPVTSPEGEEGQPLTSWAHRLALGLGTSLFVLVLSAFPLTVLGFDTVSVFGVVLAVTLVGAAAGAWRRLQIPPEQRIRLPLARLANDARAATVEASRLDAAVNVALALVVVASVATLAVGLAAPDRGNAFTDVALANESGAAGDTTYTQGAQATMPLAVENNEGQEQSYTAVVALERFSDGEAGGAALLERVELSRSAVTVPAGETATSQLTFTPSMLGADLRLSVYVYLGEAPDSPGPESADYHLYQWVTVEDGTATLATADTTAAAGA